MRLVLVLVAVLHFLAALVAPGFGLGFFATTAVTWTQQRDRLLEAGALIENPGAVGGRSDDGWWLMNELLPQFEQRTARVAYSIQACLAVQGVLFVVLAVVWRPRCKRPSDGGPCIQP